MRISDWSSDVCSSDLPATTRRWFEGQGIQAECIKLNGAMEIAPKLGLASHIVDLVSTGRTLVENALAEQTVISEVSARLIVNRAAFKLRSAEVPALVERFRQAVGDARSEEHTSELQSLMRISYAVFCLKKNKILQSPTIHD